MPTTSFGSLKDLRRNPKTQIVWGYKRGDLNHHGFLDFLKNTKKSRNETVDRELEGKAWRSLGTNVLYSIHCTVQYHDGAFKGNRVDFSAVDNDIGRSLMIDVFDTEIHGNNCTRAKVTPDQKYCSNRQDKDQFTTREDKADVSPVVIRINIDGSRIVDKLRAKDENQFTTREDNDFTPVVTDLHGKDITPTSTERWTTTETEQSLCCSGTYQANEWTPTSSCDIFQSSNQCILSSRKSRKRVLPSLARTSEVDSSSMTSTPPSTTECTLRTTIQDHEDLRCQSADRDSGPTVHLRLHLQGGR